MKIAFSEFLKRSDKITYGFSTFSEEFLYRNCFALVSNSNTCMKRLVLSMTGEKKIACSAIMFKNRALSLDTCKADKQESAPNGHISNYDVIGMIL